MVLKMTLSLTSKEREKTSDKNSIKPIKESMMVNTTPIKISVRDKKNELKEVRLT